MLRFEENFLLSEGIYLFHEEKDIFIFFELDYKGYIIDNKERVFRFNWKLNDSGLLSLNYEDEFIHDSVWKMKFRNEDYIVVDIVENDNNEKKLLKDQTIYYDFQKNEEVKDINSSLSYTKIFKSLDKEYKYRTIIFFIALFLFIFILIDNLIIIKNLNFLLKFLISCVIYIGGFRKFFEILVKYNFFDFNKDK